MYVQGANGIILLSGLSESFWKQEPYINVHEIYNYLFNWHLLANYLVSCVILVQCSEFFSQLSWDLRTAVGLLIMWSLMVSLKFLNESLYLILNFQTFNRPIEEIEHSEFWRMVVHIAFSRHYATIRATSKRTHCCRAGRLCWRPGYSLLTDLCRSGPVMLFWLSNL